MKKLLKGIFICLFAILLMSHNADAADIDQTSVAYYRTLAYNLRYSCFGSSGTSYTWQQAGTTCHMGASREINSVYMKTVNEPDLATGEYFFEIYLEVSGGSTYGAPLWFGAQTGYPMTFINEEQVSSTTRGDITRRVYRLLYHWQGGVNLNSDANIFNISAGGGIFNSEGLRVNSVVLWKVIPTGSSLGDIVSAINSQSSILRSIDTNIIYGVQHLENIEDYLEGLEGMGQDVSDIKDQLEQRQQQEDDALDNIEDQTPEDISENSETENQATTNLIGLFQSFITALSGITQANNCNINLAFPSYAGGNITVNVCQNKDKGGNIVAVFSSLTLIIFYIPLALKLLSMIYNEIRSFTNG